MSPGRFHSVALGGTHLGDTRVYRSWVVETATITPKCVPPAQLDGWTARIPSFVGGDCVGPANEVGSLRSIDGEPQPNPFWISSPSSDVVPIGRQGDPVDWSPQRDSLKRAGSAGWADAVAPYGRRGVVAHPPSQGSLLKNVRGGGTHSRVIACVSSSQGRFVASPLKCVPPER